MTAALRRDQGRRREGLLAEPPCSCAEFAGGTAAECAAVWCCFPCGILNLLVVFVYKLPRAICRRTAGSRRRRRALRRGASVSRVGSDPDLQVHPVGPEMEVGNGACSEEEVRRVEKEMWESFYGTGFWRSPSQKEVQ